MFWWEKKSARVLKHEAVEASASGVKYMYSVLLYLKLPFLMRPEIRSVGVGGGMRGMKKGERGREL